MFAALLALAIVGCKSQAQEQVKLESQMDKVSYTIGLQLGGSFKQQSMDINQAALFAGIKDALSGAKPMMTDDECRVCMETFQNEMMSKQTADMKDKGDANIKEGETFLAENKKKEGVVTTASGLQYKVLTPGSGRKPAATDTVTVHYRGTLISGKQFDSSYDRKEPTTFPVNGVIQGWQEALQLMPLGSKYELYIPADLAYGSRGAGPDIGPNSVLIFQVELLSIK